jgi:hypothetical protein
MHQAAKMTGYHQDYLGQMARSGKLEAHKMGRNWFTTKLAIDKMLGRAPKEDVQPVIQSAAEPAAVPVVEETIREIVAPQPALEPVIEPAQVLQAEVYETEKFAAAEVAVEIEQAREKFVPPVVIRKSMVKVKHLRISDDAGPNLQESLSLPQPEMNAAVNIIGAENKNHYFRWQKLMGREADERRHKLEIAQIKNELHAVSEGLDRAQRSLTQKISQKETAPRSGFSWAHLSFALASVCLAVVGTAYIVSDYFSDVTSSLQEMQPIAARQDKMVAGESTVYSTTLWPPPYINGVLVTPEN